MSPCFASLRNSALSALSSLGYNQIPYAAAGNFLINVIRAESSRNSHTISSTPGIEGFSFPSGFSFPGNDNSISIRSVSRCNPISQLVAEWWQLKQNLHAATTAACNPRISEFSIPAESAMYRAAPPAAAARRSSASICSNIFWLWVAITRCSLAPHRTLPGSPGNNTIHPRKALRSFAPCRSCSISRSGNTLRSYRIACKQSVVWRPSSPLAKLYLSARPPASLRFVAMLNVRRYRCLRHREP
jgi:hypothetical protein